jgi:hypothetical protein
MVKTKRAPDADLKSKSKQAGIDFDLRPVVLNNDVELGLYLNKYQHWRDPGIGIQICKGDVNFGEAAPEGGVYFSPMVLAMGVHLPLSPFIREMLCYYNLPPAQLGPGSWRVALAYEALCRVQECLCDLAVFRALYQIRATKDAIQCFVPRKRKLITNTLTSDSGWKNVFAVVSGPWESADPSECGWIPRCFTTIGKRTPPQSFYAIAWIFRLILLT